MYSDGQGTEECQQPASMSVIRTRCFDFLQATFNTKLME